MIVAVEQDAVFAHYGDVEKLSAPKGFEVYVHRDIKYELYIMNCGMGTVLAACGTQYLIDKYGVDVIVDFGVVGGLTPEMKVEKMVIIDKVVHYRYDCSEFMDLKVGQVADHDSIYLYTDKELVQKALKLSPGLKTATIASGDRFVSKAEDKAKIHEDFGCDVCDMESSGIVLTCEANNIPCLLFKAVSDGLQGGANEFWQELNKVSLICLKLTDEILDIMYN